MRKKISKIKVFKLFYYSLFYPIVNDNLKNTKIVKMLDPYTYSQHKLVSDISRANRSTQSNSMSKVIDVGSGSQWPKKEFENNNFTYLGGDVKDSSHFPKQDFTLVDESLPFESNSTDIVLSFSVLEHLNSPMKSIQEAERILKKGGMLVLQTNFLYQEHGTPHDYFRFTTNGLSHLTKKAGFTAITVTKIGNRLTLSQHNLLYWYLNHLNSVLGVYLKRKYLIRLLLGFPFFLFCLICLPLTLILFIYLSLVNLIGQYQSRKNNLFYTGVSLIAVK
ncbi:unannotated protein [freshwater metagenome]|uniref:Unannotated protein n=1 Tax=freshwater metagenome TaxID=449393 RepID=A0A6J6E971_9ZZZZ|nr:methyltransferase domain-containing protein [Actinomycetota bacterium]